MSLTYAYNPQIWPSICTVLLLVALAIFGWRRRSVPGDLPFLIGCLFAAAWAASSVMEYAALDLAQRKSLLVAGVIAHEGGASGKKYLSGVRG